jgi:DNA-binding transcriptional MerR regulator
VERKTLLEKAKAHPAGHRAVRKYDDELIELVLAWANAEITTKQISTALEKRISNVYPVIAQTFRYLMMEGALKTDGFLK